MHLLHSAVGKDGQITEKAGDDNYLISKAISEEKVFLGGGAEMSVPSWAHEQICD